MTDATARAGWRRLALLLVGVELFTLGLLSALILHQQRSLLLDLTASKIAVSTSDIDLAAHTGLENGLALEEQRMLQPLLERLPGAMPEIRGADVFSLASGASAVRFSLDAKRIGMPLDPRLVVLTTRNPALWREAEGGSVIRVGRQLRDDRDRLVGGYVVSADARAFEARADQARSEFMPSVLVAMLATGVLTLAALAVLALRAGAPTPALRHRIVALTFAITLAAAFSLGWQATRLSSIALQPAVEAKAASVAEFLESKLQRAVALGVPFEHLGGIQDYFDDALSEHRELSALLLFAKEGRVIAEAGNTALVAKTSGDVLRHDFQLPKGESLRIEVRTDPGYIAQSMRAILADLGIVLLVALLVFNEVLRALLPRLLPRAEAAARAPASSLADIRLPLFLIILTEELTRSFLPLHIREMASDASVAGLLGTATATGLPMTVYMIFFALATPLGGMLTDRMGARRVFSLAAAFTVVGFAWAAATTDFWQFTATRALCATGYALGTMACQRVILSLSDRESRAQGLALLIGAVGIAAICGSSIGGVVVERLGAAPVFAMSAAIAALALMAFLGMQQDESSREPSPNLTEPAAEPNFRFGDILRLLAQGRFAALMIAAAIPAKIALAGFLFYLVPLALAQAGYAPAAIGRAVMVYFILISFLTPLASRLSDRYRLRFSPVIVGGLVIGLGGLAGLASGAIGSDRAVMLGIVALGVGTGLSAASLQALASEVGTRDGRIGQVAVVAVFRTIERLGSALGPVLAGAMLAALDYGGVMSAIGALVLTATLLLLLPGVRRHG